MAKTELRPIDRPLHRPSQNPTPRKAVRPEGYPAQRTPPETGRAGLAYQIPRRVAVAVAAVAAIVIDPPSNSFELALRVAAALTVVGLEAAQIGATLLMRRRSHLGSMLSLVALVGLGLTNPAALVPIAVALTAGYLCCLGPNRVQASAAVIQLGGTALIGAFSNRPEDLRLLLPIMLIADATKAAGVHLFTARLRAIDQRVDTMLEQSRKVAWSLAERLRHQNDHDALTGLPNRARLKEYLRETAAAGVPPGHGFALLLMDLTQFRQVNDALGHQGGDRLLAAIAVRLRAELAGQCGMIGRWGGDEFALVSPPVGDEEEALGLARRAIGVLERPFEVDGIPVQCSGNLGIALFPEHGKGDEDLLNAADEALYRAKRSGQPVELYRAERHQGSLRQVTLLGELGRAMDAGELALYYQPALGLGTERVVQVEALVRWQHRDHGLMLPIDFIETVEGSHMIHSLTRWIVAEALRDAEAMHQAGLDLGVAVNVSVRNLQDPDLVDFFELLSHREDFHAERLQLEITETELIDDNPRAVEVLARLRALGISVAVDDFGVGNASLSYLKHLPVSHLKIDRGFVTAMTSNSDDAAIVRSTIEMAHQLGLTVTAEGATDLTTLTTLREMGCDLAQGFYISEPVPFDDLVPLVTHLDATAPALLRGAGPIEARLGQPSALVATSPAQR